MKSTRFSLTMLMGLMLVTNATVAEDSTEVPVLLARFSEGSASLRTLFLYSKLELNDVYVWLNREWTATKTAKVPSEDNPYYVYRVSSRFVPEDGRTLRVNSWISAQGKTYRHELRIHETESDYSVGAKLLNVRTREEYLAAKREQDQRRAASLAEMNSDPYGFIPLLNQYRATRGLRPVSHDPGLSRDAQVNNTMSVPHGYMGSARVQNWASGFTSASGVLRGWQQSPGHNQSLLDPSISRAGIAYSQGEWTFCGR